MRKRKPKRLTRHHLIPKSIGGTNSPDNLQTLTEAEHRGFHHAFGILSPCAIAKRLKEKFVPKEFHFEVTREGGCEGCPWKKKCSLRR